MSAAITRPSATRFASANCSASSIVESTRVGETDRSIRCRINEIDSSRIAALTSRRGASTCATTSRFRSVLPRSASSDGARRPCVPARWLMSSSRRPICSCASDACWHDVTSSMISLRSACSLNASIRSPRSTMTSAASSPRPSDAAITSSSSRSCVRAAKCPTMSRSTSAIFSSSVRKTLPGCGSAWKKPSTMIWCRYARTSSRPRRSTWTSSRVSGLSAVTFAPRT